MRGARGTRSVAVGAFLALTVLGPGTPAVAVERQAAAVAAASEVGDDVTYYVVKDQWEGQPEFLYAIAVRLLGNGDRAAEIFALNEGRAQPGGAVVADPNVISPGWVLVLPSDATGEGVQVGPLPTPAPATVPTDLAPTPSAAPDDDAADGDTTAGSGAVTAVVVGAVLVAGALLVPVVRIVLARVRARRGAAAAPVLTVVRRDDPGAWTIDRATRALAHACADAGRAVPAAHALVVGDDQVRLRLGTPDARPPSGWAVTEDGLTWTSPMGPLQDLALAADVVAPFPRLVTLGDGAQGRVLLDLAQAGPGVTLDGDVTQARRLAEQWCRELATNPWSRQVPVVAVGTGAGAFGRLDEAGAAVEAAGGGVLVVARTRARDADLLAALAHDPEWTAVVVGPAVGGRTRWRLTIDARGVARGGPLDADVHLLPGDRSLDPA